MYNPLIQYYNDMLHKYGPDRPEALGWRGDDSQMVRFQVLSEVANLSGRSVLDEGCGLGDLYGFLKTRYQNFEYKGIDINEQLIAKAKQKYPDARFEVADFSEYVGERVDFVLASGTLTFNIPNYREVYFAQIMKMFDMARTGVAFNVLDAKFFEGNDLYVTYDVNELYDFCARLTNKIVVRHDYSPEDITFYLYH